MSHYWDTSSEGIGPCTKPMELATLGEHNALCSKASARWQALQCGAGRTVGFLAARPVTAGVVLIVGLGLPLVWF